MKCKHCGVNKLSKEFPSVTLTDNCDHPRHHCLRCVTSYWEKNKQCSQCNEPVPESSSSLRKCQYALERMFPQVKSNEEAQEDVFSTSGSITVTRLDGESFDLPFEGTMTISQLKRKVLDFMRVHPDKQSLLYDGKNLQVIDEVKIVHNTLFSCGVQPNTTIFVMVLLYAVPSNLSKVVFDLYWEFPTSGKDYLDACAWAFEGQHCDDHVRFINKTAYVGALYHSGDKMDLRKSRGHQIILVDLHRIPSHITHIFFTLSSYSSRTISHFRNPCMKFFDAAKPDCMLCEDQINSAGHKQAIVMCSLQRIEKKWFVISNGALSDGQAQTGIKPLLETIQGIIAKTGKYPHVPLSIVNSLITDPAQLAIVNARK